MKQFVTKTLIILATAMVFMLATASEPSHTIAYAQTSEPTGSPAKANLETTDASGKRINCNSLPEAKGVLIGRIVPCVTKTIETTTQGFSSKMIAQLRPTVWSFIFLVIVLFGVRILRGDAEPQKEGMLLLLKLGIVIALLQMIPTTLVPALYGVMAESQEIIAEAVGPDSTSIKCDMEKYRADGGLLVWAHMDCIMGKLFGFTVGSETSADGAKKPNMLLGASLFGLMGGFFFGGSFGITLFFGLIGVLITMFLLVIRTISAFLTGYLYSSIMLILSPIFVPLMLFTGTMKYFDAWWRGILGSILMPIMITSYTMFALLLYDKMLFADDSLLNELFNNKLVEKIQDLPKPVCNLQRPANPVQRSKSTGLAMEDLYKNNPLVMSVINPLLSASNNQCLGLTTPSVDISKMLEDTDANKIDGESPKALFSKLFRDAIKLFVLAFIIDLGYRNIMVLIRLITGVGSVLEAVNPNRQTSAMMAGLKESVKSGAERAFDLGKDEQGRDRGTASGAEFIQRLGSVDNAIGQNIRDNFGGKGRK